MKNELKYFYNIDTDKIIKKGKNYYFEFQNERYKLTQCERTIHELNELNDVIKIMHLNQVYCHQIIPNIFSLYTTTINAIDYILLKMYIYSEESISLNDIISFSKKNLVSKKFKYIDRSNWKELWINKVNNIEYQLDQTDHYSLNEKYIFNYYAGLFENSLQIYEENKNINIKKTVAHKRIFFDMNYEDFYNPLNFIIDITIRDIGEYINNRCFKGGIIDEIILYLFRIYSKEELIFLFVRILFPSNQLDQYERKLMNNKEAISFNMCLQHEKNIKKIYDLFKSHISNFIPIEWLIHQQH